MRGASLIVASVLFLAGAPAATADTPTLAQLPGSAGCLISPGASPDTGSAARCAPARLPLEVSLAASPDGRHVYATGFLQGGNGGVGGVGGVLTLDRDRTTGALSQRGCPQIYAPCSGTEVRALDARKSVVSPDGRNVYVAVSGIALGPTGGVVSFARDASSGQLTRIGCNGHTEGCNLDDMALVGATAVTMPPDGRHVYVSAQGRLITLARAGDGTLSRVDCIGSQAGCERHPDRSSCSPFGGCRSEGAYATGELAVSPDSRQLYMAGDRPVPRVFSRNQASGGLTPLPDPPCDALGVNLCGKALYSTALAVARNGRDVYSALAALETSPSQPTIMRSKPLAGGPALAPWGCLGGALALPCGDAGVAERVGALAMAPDDRAVYASFDGYSVPLGAEPPEAGVAVLSRRDTGALAPASCVSSAGAAGRCVQGPGLRAPRDILVSPDGRNVYVAGWSSQIAVLGPSVAMAARSVSFDGKGRSRVGLSCPGMAASPCRGTVVLAAGARRKTVARRGFSLVPGRRSRLAVRLNRAGLRAVRRGRRTQGEVRLGARGRVSGRSVRQITLRRARSRR